MPVPVGSRLRAAQLEDASAIAELHADSWRRHYRGAYSDDFLDHDVDEFLLTLWIGRLTAPSPRARTIAAELDGQITGFAHVVLDASATWGALLDNLHVSFARKRSGTGTRLLAQAGQTVTDEAPGSGLYLWVLEQNAAARAFYDTLGGTAVERTDAGAPGGDPARLRGRPAILRYAWPEPSQVAG